MNGQSALVLHTKLSFLDRLRQLFGLKLPYHYEQSKLSRYTVHSIRCEVCDKPMRDGNLMITRDLLRDPGTDKELKVGEYTPMVHAECLVQILQEDGSLAPPQQPHRHSMVLTRKEWEDWLQSINEKMRDKE